MSVDFHSAAAELNWFTLKLRNVLALSDELQRIGSVEQAGREAQARLDAFAQRQAEIEAAHQTKLDEMTAKVAAADDQLRHLQETATLQHDSINTQIEDKRAALAAVSQDIAAAQAELGPLRQEKAQIESFKSSFALIKDTVDQQLAAKHTEIAAAEAALAEIETKHAAAVEAHNALKAKLL